MNAGQAVVHKLTVARLFNLGNYEHERIEVEVRGRGYELHDGTPVESAIENPAAVLTELRELLEKAKPIQMDWDAERGFEIDRGELKIDDSLEAPAGTVGSGEAEAMLEALKKWRASVADQKVAIARLNELGTVRIEGGAS